MNDIACRWLSVYDSSIDFDYAFDAYYIYFLLYEKARINVEIAKISKTKENSSKTIKEFEQEAHRVDKKLNKKLNLVKNYKKSKIDLLISGNHAHQRAGIEN